VTEIETKHTLRSPAWQLLAASAPPARPGGERLAAKWVAGAVQELGLGRAQMGRIREAVTEGLRKVIDLADQDQHNLPVLIRIWISARYPEDLSMSRQETETGDRWGTSSWGFFLIQKQEDDPQAPAGELRHVIELFLYQERERPRRKGDFR
jgi:hypothetical protein